MGVSANPPAAARSVSEMKARIEAERAGRPFVLYRDGEGAQRILAFGSELATVTAGRGRSADLVRDWDDQVSRVHARFEATGAGWGIVDDGLSRNGTFVNGERLAGLRLLHDGDSLRFGDVTAAFRIPDPGGWAAHVGGPPGRVELSSTQRRVLVALCGIYGEGGALAGPEVDERLAEELFLAPGTLRTHLSVLFAKFGVEGLPEGQRRMLVIDHAISTGLVSDRDL